MKVESIETPGDETLYEVTTRWIATGQDLLYLVEDNKISGFPQVKNAGECPLYAIMKVFGDKKKWVEISVVPVSDGTQKSPESYTPSSEVLSFVNDNMGYVAKYMRGKY